MPNSVFKTIFPKDEKLKNYIAYYYFHSSESPDFEQSFWFYPNYKYAITVYKNSRIVTTQTSSNVSPLTEDYAPYILFSPNIFEKIKVSITGPFSKIGIVFHPLGVNHFFQKPVNHYLEKALPYQLTFMGSLFDKTIKTVFDTDSIEEKGAALDAYFSNHYYGFKDIALLQAVQFILENVDTASASSIADHLGINRRTLLRYFKKHLLCSVKDFIQVVRFRKAVDYYMNEDNQVSLTEAAYQAAYYDQAHFNKHFLVKAEEKPSSLFKNITRFGDKGTYWKIDKNK